MMVQVIMKLIYLQDFDIDSASLEKTDCADSCGGSICLHSLFIKGLVRRIFGPANSPAQLPVLIRITPSSAQAYPVSTR